MMKKLFKRGAWLYTLERELSEEKFIEAAGGVNELLRLKQFPFVSVLFENDGVTMSKLAGHMNGRSISIVIGPRKFQTMEWR